MAKTIPFYIVDSFAGSPFEGNPAGVFLDCDDLDEETMHRLAGEISLESAFVMRSTNDVDTVRMRYFTGAIEVPFCGHDTVAAVTVLAQTERVAAGNSLSIETMAGTILVSSERLASGALRVEMRQPTAPIFGKLLDHQQISTVAFGLCTPLAAILDTNLPVCSVSTGTPFLFVPVTNRAFVDGISNRTPMFSFLKGFCEKTETLGIYVFAREIASNGSLLIWSRNYCPLAGIDEDPVTGSAAGALGGYLWSIGELPSDRRFTVQQGFGGGRGGQADVAVRVEGDRIDSITVSGTATVLASGVFTLP